MCLKQWSKIIFTVGHSQKQETALVLVVHVAKTDAILYKEFTIAKVAQDVSGVLVVV